MVRVILPVRMKVRGGRTWLTRPDGGKATPRLKVDKNLIRALRASHAVVGDLGLMMSGSAQKSPITTYDRRLCALAFMAPDLQQAILEGRQPTSLNLEQLIHHEMPLAWADQRIAFGF